jgi:TolB-like protein
MQPLPAYQGEDKYIFVSYSHADEEAVFNEIRWLQDQGINVWYDTSGIEPGLEWTEEIAGAIKGATHFVYFVTPHSAASEHCRRELNFAQSENIDVVVVHLESTELPDGLRLSLDHRQAILKYRLQIEAYQQAVLTALVRPPAANGSLRIPKRRPPTHWIAVALVVALVGASLWWLVPDSDEAIGRDQATTTSQAEPEPYLLSNDQNAQLFIAVLPFASHSQNEDRDYIAATFTDEIRAQLQKQPALAVISPLTANLLREAKDVRQAGESLGIDYVVEGSVNRTTDATRVRVSLVNMESGVRDWSDQYDLSNTDLTEQFSLYDEISREITLELQTYVDSTHSPFVESEPPTRSLAAYNAYRDAIYTSWFSFGLKPQEALSLISIDRPLLTMQQNSSRQGRISSISERNISLRVRFFFDSNSRSANPFCFTPQRLFDYSGQGFQSQEQPGACHGRASIRDHQASLGPLFALANFYSVRKELATT